MANSTCFGSQSHPLSGVYKLYMATGKLAHCKLTNNICYNNVYEHNNQYTAYVLLMMGEIVTRNM